MKKTLFSILVALTMVTSTPSAEAGKNISRSSLLKQNTPAYFLKIHNNSVNKMKQYIGRHKFVYSPTEIKISISTKQWDVDIELTSKYLQTCKTIQTFHNGINKHCYTDTNLDGRVDFEAHHVTASSGGIILKKPNTSLLL